MPAGGRYVHRITPADVGSRVTIRSRLPDPEPGGPTTTDVVGRLVDWSEDDLVTVERRDGVTVTVAAAAIVASRVIPARPL